MSNTTVAPGRVPTAPRRSLGATLLRVAWLAVLLGLGMEVLLLVLGGAMGERLGLGAAVADLARNLSWAVFVCVGLAIGTTVANARVALGGLAGFLAAPAAFEISRVVHKGVAEALSAPSGASTGIALAIALVKALEYGFLGLAVGWLARRAWAGVASYAAAGLVAGAVFGGVNVVLTASAPGSLVARGVNEILFPVGCALVLFAAGAVARKIEENGGGER